MKEELYELLEGVTNAVDAFIKSEINLNDGEIALSQKYSKQGQILLRSMINDSFLEIIEVLNSSLPYCQEECENVMELIKALNEISMASASLLANDGDDKSGRIMKNKLLQCIAKVKNSYLKMFEN